MLIYRLVQANRSTLFCNLLLGIGFPPHAFLTALATPAGKEADTGTGGGFEVGDKIGVVAVLARTILVNERGQLEA